MNLFVVAMIHVRGGAPAAVLPEEDAYARLRLIIMEKVRHFKSERPFWST